MRILQMCDDMFDQIPKKSVKEFFHEMRKIETAKPDRDDRGFFRFCSQCLGGRGYKDF